MVENSGFINRLRNVHLEKPVATGICRVRRPPKTAKTPCKVHLRLRFQNLGKPRTAGLCGRTAGACDCGLLSCTKIERPSPLEKPSCKVQLFAQNRSRNYRQKVTATDSISNRFSSRFSTSLTNGPRSLSLPKAGTHSALCEKSHTAAYTAKQGAFPPSATAGLVPSAKFLLVLHAFIYIHFPVHCEPSTPAEEKNLSKLPSQTLSQTIFHRVFQLLPQTAHVCFHGRKCVHTRPCSKNRTQRPTRRNTGLPDGAAITTLDTYCTFTNFPGPGVRTANFAALGSWPGGALEERREPAGQRCAYARRCPAGVAAPLGCAALFAIW